MVDVLFHLHIPKTAGTAVRESLKRSLHLNEVLEWYPDDPYFVDGWLPALKEVFSKRPEIRLVSGHYLYGAHRALPKTKSFKYFTVLRDPIARVISHYVHDIHHNLLYIKRENALKIVSAESISEYVRDSIPSYYYNNLQTRYISGIRSASFNNLTSKELMETCARHISEHFCNVLSQSRLDRDLHSIFSLLNISKSELGQENSKGRLSANMCLTRTDLRELTDLNFLDFQLLSLLKLSDLAQPDIDASKEDHSGFSLLRLEAFKTALLNFLSQSDKVRKRR